MKDNTVNVNGADIYLNNIYYYADQYITNELELSRDDDNYIQTVADNFVGMILYIHDNIQKPSNDDIELLDSIFSIYTRLCSKYRVLPTLECFSFLVGVERRTLRIGVMARRGALLTPTRSKNGSIHAKVLH